MSQINGVFREWQTKAAFDYMRTYSPYGDVAAKDYPASLVQTSFDDSQMMYWEPSKYVAKLRALKTDKQPLVFFINMHGGHGGRADDTTGSRNPTGDLPSC